jgi:hypothetical protein
MPLVHGLLEGADRSRQFAPTSGLSTGSPTVRFVMPFENLVPPELLGLSGSVYYSGRDAFTGPSPLYILGLNPGGDPAASTADTIGSHLEYARPLPERWSAYRHQSWAGRPAGTHPLQRSVLHLLDRLGLDPSDVPSSNLVFARSRSEATMPDYADECWAFHAAVVETLDVKAVVCFGGQAAGYARTRLNAHREVGRYKETNKRGNTSLTYESPSGLRVVKVTHPSRHSWSNPEADVTGLVAASLAE